MKEGLISLQKSLSLLGKANKAYRKLQKHLHKMPVGYPSTLTGIELHLLQQFFSLREAEAALYLDHNFTDMETIFSRVKKNEFSKEEFAALLDEMERKGSIFSRFRNDKKLYALHPLLVGIFEMQYRHLTAGLFLDMRKYMAQGFLIEYLSTNVPQMRVIPVEKSITVQHNVATYDEVRNIVDRSRDGIGIIDCACKKGKDLLGDPCKVTERREICIFLGDYCTKLHRDDWKFGRNISKKDTFSLLDKNEKDGLVLMSTSYQEPGMICSCCGCCCGPLEMVSSMPRPADFVASNFRAVLDPATCNGCGRCFKRCQMKAVIMEADGKNAVSVDEKRCIGCGLCVATCKTGSLTLEKKEREFIPPKDHDELYEILLQNKKSAAGKFLSIGKALIGVEVKR